MLLCQFTDLNTETKGVLHGVNTPWNISSFWSCLSHLWSHLSAQVPLSFVVWTELFLVNWIPCYSCWSHFIPTLSYFLMPLVWPWGLSATKICHIKYFIITPCINIMLYASSLRLFELFFALEITKILLKNHAIFLAFTVFSLTFLISFSLSIYSSLSCTPKGTLLLVIFYPAFTICLCRLLYHFMSVIYKHPFVFFSFLLFSSPIFHPVF